MAILVTLPRLAAIRQAQALYGAFDMAGNVWEWTADFYSPDYYSISPKDNPQGPETGSVFVERGGSWKFSERPVRSTYRHHYIPPILGSFVNSAQL